MKIEEIARTIQREAAASPQKAIVLGVVFVIALYFWFPLVLGWMKGADGGEVVTEGSGQVATVGGSGIGEGAGSITSVPSTPVAKDKSSLGMPWRQIAAILDKDARMEPVDLRPTLSRNKSFMGRAGTGLAQTEMENSETAIHVFSNPDELGLTLSSTILGTANKTALISGKAYQLGEPVPASQGVELTLVEIYADHVVLEYLGRKLELFLPKAGKISHVELDQAAR